MFLFFSPFFSNDLETHCVQDSRKVVPKVLLFHPNLFKIT